MKVQKRQRLKRAAALLFSFVLITGTSGIVFAQENNVAQEPIRESSLELEDLIKESEKEADIKPAETQPAESDTTSDETQPEEPDTTPDETQPEEPGTTPDENQPEEPDTTPDENQPEEPGTTPDENQPEEPGTTPDENQPAEPGTTPDENQPTEPGTTPDGNQPEQPDAKPGENQTEKPGTSPEKEPSKKEDEELSKPASRTLSARSGIEDSSDYMWYTSLNNEQHFDIKGIDKGNQIQTTYQNKGYTTIYETEEYGQKEIKTSDAAYMGNSLYGKRELSLLDNGKYVMVRYIVENRGDSVQTFKIGSSADVMIGNNDKAPVVGTSTGLSMSGEPENNYKFNLFAPTVTTLWYGWWSDADRNVFTDLPDKSTPYKDDSGMAWSWTGTVSPGMTWSRYVLIGVGDLPEPPGDPAIITEELKAGIPDEMIIGTADPNNTVYIEMLGEEYTVKADENGEFSLPITLPADTPEGPAVTNCYAISPEGGISNIVDGSIEIIGAPFIILKETETLVAKDSELDEEWYQSFIESSRGDISFDASEVKVGELGTYDVIYTAQKDGFDDATAILTIEVVDHIHDYGTEWQSNETNHWKECTICGEKAEEDAHSFDDKWVTDETNHWKECTVCGKKIEEAAHSFGDWVTDQKPTEETEGIKHRDCSACGYSERGTIPVLEHEHNFGADWKSNETSHWHECRCGEKKDIASHSFGEWITDQEATEETEGEKHRNCSVCGYNERGTIPVLEHEHNFGTDWKSNETNHWHECKCGEKSDISSHSFGAWITDRAATETEAGTRHRECSECGYREEGTIPATGRTDTPEEDDEEEESEPEEPRTPTDDREGNFAKSVEKLDGVPDVDVVTPAAELQSMLLTNTERQQMRNGASIRVVFDVKVAETTVSNTDRTLVESALNESSLNDFTMGQYLDISLYKLIDKTRIDINETPQKITVTIDVPEDLRNAGSARTFAVIRVHNGQTEILNDLDDDDDTITIETDRFSTYAVVYKDLAGGNGHISQNPNTGNNSLLELFMMLAMAAAGGAFLFLYFSGRKKG